MANRLRRTLLYPARHLRWRIIAPFALITLVLAGAGAFLVTRLVVTSLEERFDNQLAEASRVAADAVVRHERQHLETVRAAAFTEGMAAALDARDEAAIRRIAEPIAANDHAAIVEVLDTQGQRIYGARLSDEDTLTYTALDEPADRSAWGIVDSVMSGRSDGQGDKFADIVTTGAGAALYTAAPVRAADGRLAGIVLAGTPLSMLVPQIKNEALADITLYDARGASLATTLRADDGDALDLRLDDGVLEGGAGGTAVRGHKGVSGRGYDLLYGDVRVRDASLGYYSVALPSSFVLSTGAATRGQLIALFTVGTLAVLCVGWFISRTITEPIFRLVGAARAVATGDLTARARISGDDEIAALGGAFDAMAERVQGQHLATIRALASAIDARDPNTLGHSLRVGQLAVEIGRELGIDAAKLHHLEVGGYLHDIGKIGVRDDVLLKTGALTPQERAEIERHPQIGLSILAPVELAEEVIDFVSGHHEKIDGSGYPRGAQGDEVGWVMRIATVADIYDALRTDRPYKTGSTVPEALAMLRKDVAANRLDASVVAALEAVIPRWEKRRMTEASLAGFVLPNAQRAA